MLIAELSIAVQHQLPIKIVVLKNDSFSEVRFDLPPIDFLAFARAFRCANPS
jgi:thiamine pyrophosphate-dependent acetolactate synthase large subunit-like protein